WPDGKRSTARKRRRSIATWPITRSLRPLALSEEGALDASIVLAHVWLPSRARAVGPLPVVHRVSEARAVDQAGAGSGFRSGRPEAIRDPVGIESVRGTAPRRRAANPEDGAIRPLPIRIGRRVLAADPKLDESEDRVPRASEPVVFRVV